MEQSFENKNHIEEADLGLLSTTRVTRRFIFQTIGAIAARSFLTPQVYAQTKFYQTNPRLEAAVLRLRENERTSPLAQLIDERPIRVEFVPGYFSRFSLANGTGIIHINERLQLANSTTLSALIAREAYLIQSTLVEPYTGQICMDEHIKAFELMTAYWRDNYPAGNPFPQNTEEAYINALVDLQDRDPKAFLNDIIGGSEATCGAIANR